MNTLSLTTTACLAVLIFVDGSVWSRPVDLSAPSGELGAANSKGYLEIWREIEDAGIDFGKGSYLPLRYKFTSNDSRGGILGPGFYMPMFEARNVLIRESTMRAYLPCGKGLYFWRDSVDSSKFQTVDKEWTGALSANSDFTAWRNDGWTIFYHQGRLSSILTDERHIFSWDYDSNTNMATGISEDGKSLIRVEPDLQGLVGAIIFSGKRYELSYAPRPLLEVIAGQAVIKKLDLALSSFKFPDGKLETFKFGLTPDRIPTVTFTDTNREFTTYAWDVATSHIAWEKGNRGDWTYNIGQIEQEFGLPSITRVSPDGKSERISIDSHTGIYSVKGVDDVVTVTHVFETPGPLYHKVQRIEAIETLDGGSITKQVYRASYDEAGNLIREVDKSGLITNFNNNAKTNIGSQEVSFTFTAEGMERLKSRELALLAAIQTAPSTDLQQDAIQDLAYFYLDSWKDPTKALSLLPQLHYDKAYIVRLENIQFENKVRSPNEIISDYQNLLSDYPDQRDAINFLIKYTTK